MHDHLIGDLTPQQRLAWMALLPTWLLPALLAQALGLPHEAVRRGRQVTVVAVFRQPLFQQLNTLLQLLDQFIPLRQLLTQDGILLFHLTKSFFWSHTATLHIFRLLGKPIGDLSSYRHTL